MADKTSDQKIESLRQLAKLAVQAAVGAKFKLGDFAAKIDYAEPKFGDFATNAPFVLAAQLKQAPPDIAGQLAAAIDDQHFTAQAAGGYVNLRVKDQAWLKALASISEGYGSSQQGKGERVQVEFISANPTGPLTLGNARGGFIGDTLARVLRHAGYEVTREYYFNDAGTQIGKLVESVKAAAGLVHPEEVQYKGEYIQELADRFKDQLTTQSDDTLGQLLTQALFETHLRPAIDKLGIEFDVWFNERELAGKPFHQAVERLKAAGLYAERDGAQWVLTSKLGDERDRPIVKSNGDVTYLGNDIAYHLNIFEQRRFDRAIKVWGADHAGQVPSLQLTMGKLCPDKRLEFLILQFVRLMEAGREVKMSKRAGTYVTTDELIDEVGADIARFFFLQRSADSHMDFDLSLAKEDSQKNPYWYVMYAYARASSILREARNRSLAPKAAALNELLEPERQLVRQMSRLPELVGDIAQDYGVHRLTFYGLEVARDWHDLYEKVPVLTDKDKAEGRLYLVQQFAAFMREYYQILGIKPVEKM